MLTRRAFALGLLAAPAVVRAGSLEYVPRGSGLYVPKVSWVAVVTNPSGIIHTYKSVDFTSMVSIPITENGATVQFMAYDEP